MRALPRNLPALFVGLAGVLLLAAVSMPARPPLAADLPTAADPSPPASAASAADAYTDPIDLTFPMPEEARFRDGPARYSDDFDEPRAIGGVHGATDILADTGTPMSAVVGGRVGWVTGMGCAGDWAGSRNNPPSWGYAVSIDGEDGRRYVYLHLGVQDGPASDAYADGITCGVQVSRGQHIGYVGHSGNATAAWPHLHLEIHDKGVQDPYGRQLRNPYRSLRAAEQRNDYPDRPAPPAPPAPPEPPAPPVEPVERVDGADRVATAAAVATTWWEQSETAVVATSRNPADAVAGTALAAAYDAPLLLTDADRLPAATRTALDRLGVQQVFLLGGTAAVSADTAAALGRLGYDLTRIGGADRFDTAARIAWHIGPSSRLAVAPGRVGDGDAWPSALTAGGLSAGGPVPLLLTDGATVPPATAQALLERQADEVLVVGEDGQVDVDLIAALSDADVTVVGGADRYAVSAAALGLQQARGPLLVAGGHDYPDGLAAGAAAARIGGALLLVDPAGAGEATVEAAGRSNHRSLVAIGGPRALPDRAARPVADALP